jgi:hypothetical protein
MAVARSRTFSSPRGEMSGRVTVGTEGPPDRRSTADKEQAAKNQILALARELADAVFETMIAYARHWRYAAWTCPAHAIRSKCLDHIIVR